jgi:SAM-dependent methyltransferase
MKRQALWAEEQSRVLSRVAAILGGLSNKRIVEIGCGTGRMLMAARARGADVIGNDISPEACAFIRDRLEIPVHQGQPTDCLAQIGRPIDAVIMIDVIEHLVDPGTVLDSVSAALRPGGVLAITTPNGGVAGENTAAARNWVGFRVDLEHLQYLSARTINRLALTGRWSIEHLETFGYPDLKWLTAPLRPSSAPRFLMSDIIHRLPRTGILARGVLAARALRGVKQAALGRTRQDPHEGTYQLFAVLCRR